MAARDVPYSLEGAEEEHLDMRLSVVGFPTVEADIVRVDLDRWTLRAGGRWWMTGDDFWQSVRGTAGGTASIATNISSHDHPATR